MLGPCTANKGSNDDVSNLSEVKIETLHLRVTI